MNFDDFIAKYQKSPVAEYDNNVLKACPNPLVTARVSTYNHASYIAECLEGILGQRTAFPFEICIGEDDSSDGTRELCLKYARKHPDKVRLFLHSRENNIHLDGRPTGRFQSRYTSYMARGRYEAICEGDDYWTDPHKLQKQVDFLEAHPECSMCFHRVEGFREDESECILPAGDFRQMSDLEDLIIRNFIQTCSVMLRTHLTRDLPEWYSTVMPGDWPLFVLCAQRGRIGYIAETMARYRIHTGGTWSRRTSIAQWQALINTCQQIAGHLSPEHERLCNISLSRLYVRLAGAYADAGNIRAGRRNLTKSLLMCPRNPHVGPIDLCALAARLYLPTLYTTLKSMEGKYQRLAREGSVLSGRIGREDTVNR